MGNHSSSFIFCLLKELMEKCDCLNFCGDDSRVKAGKALKCPDYERLNTYDSPYTEASRYRQLVEMQDWSFIDQLRKDNPQAKPHEFYRLLSDTLDRMKQESLRVGGVTRGR